jgi:hypothetical protein
MQSFQEADMPAAAKITSPDAPPELPHYPVVEAVIETIADWVTRYRRATRGRKELRECGPEEVTRIARELGISRDELLELSGNGPGAADLVHRMLPALGVDLKSLALSDALVLHDLERLCVVCRNKGRCRHELEDRTAADNYREFCPNAVTLEALMEERGP